MKVANLAKELTGTTYYIAGVIILSASIIALLTYLYQKKFIMRKGKETQVDPQKVNFVSSKDLVEIDEARDGLSINFNKRKYSFAFQADGFDFFNSSISMQLEAVKSFQALLLSMTDLFQFHITSRKIDINDTISLYEQEALAPLHNALKDIDAQMARESMLFAEYKLAGKEDLCAESQQILGNLIAERKARILDLEILEEQDLYLGVISSGDSADVREAYYVSSYVHDPSAYSKKLNKHEIFKRASDYCNSLYSKMASGLSRSNVNSMRLGDEDIIRIQRRGMQPYYADAVPYIAVKPDEIKYSITSDIADQLEKLAEREKWEIGYMKYLKGVEGIEITEETAERIKSSAGA